MSRFKYFGMALAVELAIAVTLGVSAYAQAPAPVPNANPTSVNEQGEQLPQITVTGYVIPRVGEGPEPVTTLDQDFITKQGDQTVADVLLRLPQNFAGFTPSLNAGESTAEGGSAVNLYGLGANATLVLIDGRRQAAYPYAQFGTESFVDLNSIPLEAV